MSNVTKEKIVSLVKLQQIEIETSSIQTKLNHVDQRLAKLDDRLLDFKQVIEEQESVINELNEKYRGYETDVRMNLDRIKKSEVKLSLVKTNKEYQSSLKEIDDLKGKNSKLEDELSLLKESEAATSATLQKKQLREKKVEKIKNLFSKDEAEVIYQGSSITIRLIGLQFPSGRAIIQPEYFSLLIFC